jgi:hypothetical protein
MACPWPFSGFIPSAAMPRLFNSGNASAGAGRISRDCVRCVDFRVDSRCALVTGFPPPPIVPLSASLSRRAGGFEVCQIEKSVGGMRPWCFRFRAQAARERWELPSRIVIRDRSSRKYALSEFRRRWRSYRDRWSGSHVPRVLSDVRRQFLVSWLGKEYAQLDL